MNEKSNKKLDEIVNKKINTPVSGVEPAIELETKIYNTLKSHITKAKSDKNHKLPYPTSVAVFDLGMLFTDLEIIVSKTDNMELRKIFKLYMEGFLITAMKDDTTIQKNLLSGYNLNLNEKRIPDIVMVLDNGAKEIGLMDKMFGDTKKRNAEILLEHKSKELEIQERKKELEVNNDSIFDEE